MTGKKPSCASSSASSPTETPCTKNPRINALQDETSWTDASKAGSLQPDSSGVNLSQTGAPLSSAPFLSASSTVGSSGVPFGASSSCPTVSSKSPSHEPPSSQSASPESSSHEPSSHKSLCRQSPLFRGVLKGGIVFATLIVVGGLLRYADASGLFDASFLNEYVKDKGALGICIFLGLGVVFSAIGLPRQLMSVAAGYAFGVVAGTLIMGVALVGGGLISFYYMRFFARDVLRRRFEAKIAVIERFWLQKTFLLTLCWRLLPLGNNTLTNMLAGTSKVRALPFFSASFVGYIPQNLIFALLGSGIGFDDTQKFLYSGLLFLVSVSLGVFVYRSLRKQGEELVLITKADAD